MRPTIDLPLISKRRPRVWRAAARLLPAVVANQQARPVTASRAVAGDENGASEQEWDENRGHAAEGDEYELGEESGGDEDGDAGGELADENDEDDDDDENNDHDLDGARHNARTTLEDVAFKSRRNLRQYRDNNGASLYQGLSRAFAKRVKDGDDPRYLALHYPKKLKKGEVTINSSATERFAMGMFSTAEMERVEGAARTLAKEKGLTLEGLSRLAFPALWEKGKRRPRKAESALQAIASRARLNRTLEQIGAFLKRQLRPERVGITKPWTPEQEEKLVNLVSKEGHTWTEIDMLMERPDCRTYYMRLINRQSVKENGPWNRDEVIRLLVAINRHCQRGLQKADGANDAAWTAIHMFVRTRSVEQCRSKAMGGGHEWMWAHAMRTSPGGGMSPLEAMRLGWVKSDTDALLQALWNGGRAKYRDETDVDWGKLAPAEKWGREALRDHWKSFKQQVGSDVKGEKSFKEVVRVCLDNAHRLKGREARSFVVPKAGATIDFSKRSGKKRKNRQGDRGAAKKMANS
ncbi:RNA polymerase I enhancer binding protein [Irineochytrium annulatum]|nr:RNA polymerase I enhancer binding protein [Irineochytrium annulatum]